MELSNLSPKPPQITLLLFVSTLPLHKVTASLRGFWAMSSAGFWGAQRRGEGGSERRGRRGAAGSSRDMEPLIHGEGSSQTLTPTGQQGGRRLGAARCQSFIYIMHHEGCISMDTQ